MRVRLWSSISCVLVMVLFVGPLLGAEHKDGEPFDRTGLVKVFDGAFIGGEGCNITLKIEGETDEVGLQVVNDSPVGKSIAGLRDKSARIRGKWRFHKGVEASDFWFVDVEAAEAATGSAK